MFFWCKNVSSTRYKMSSPSKTKIIIWKFIHITHSIIYHHEWPKIVFCRSQCHWESSNSWGSPGIRFSLVFFSYRVPFRILSDRNTFWVLSDRVFFRFLSDRVLFNVLSDGNFFRVLSDRVLFKVLKNGILFRFLSDWILFRFRFGVLSDKLFFRVFSDKFLSWVFSPLFPVR